MSQAGERNRCQWCGRVSDVAEWREDRCPHCGWDFWHGAQEEEA
jgi:DNA-directed RNA polymerase subunit RPC12/RpoP